MKVKGKNSFEKKSFIGCINGDCPQSAECLRHLYYKSLGDKPLLISILNPKAVCGQLGDCPHFKSSAPQIVAFGFIGILGSLPHSVARSFVDELMCTFGRKYYYQMRKGERYILKEDQDLILSAARTHGATHLEFDKYDEIVVY